MRRCESVSRLSALLVTVLSGGGLMVACSGSSPSGFGNPGPGFQATGADAATTTPIVTVDGSVGTVPGQTGSLTPSGQDAQAATKADASCAGSVTRAQQSPLDIYIMLDQSLSMQGSPWSEVTTAIESFVSQPLTGVSVGIQFFGLPGSSAGSGGGHGGGHGGGDSCTASDYATPAVEIGALPGNGAAITTSIAAHSPSTSTPTSAALQGAIDHCETWAAAHPGHVVAALLATDGEPTECDTSLSDINAIAAAGLGNNPKVLTFVIGVNDSGTSLSNLNGIAAAGGTTSAFMVTTGSSSATTAFLAALNQIRGTALGCQYAIPLPDGGTPDFAKVNVVYTPGGGGAAETIPNVSTAASCPSTGDAWYFNSNTAPTEILLCGATCTKVQGDSTGEVSVVMGCPTVIAPPSK